MRKVKPVAWLATVQQQFMEGQNCDVIIRVSIEQPTTKRARANNAAGDGASRREQGRTVVGGTVEGMTCSRRSRCRGSWASDLQPHSPVYVQVRERGVFSVVAVKSLGENGVGVYGSRA